MKDTYLQWCQENGETPMHASDFITQLTDKGITDGMKDNKRSWLGIKVTYDAMPQPEGKPEEAQTPLEDENCETIF